MKKFEELSLSFQKRRIVKDAIKQINEGVVTIKAGSGYLRGLYTGDYDTKNLQEILQNNKRVCTVCAKGSLFTACVLNVNKVKTSQDIQSESFQKSKLRKWFAPLELDMIEAAFEKVVICDTARKLQVMLPSFKTKPTKLGKKCILFGRQFKTPKERMLAILENILVNKTFTP